MPRPLGAASPSPFSRAPTALGVQNSDDRHARVFVVASSDNKLSSGHSLVSTNWTDNQFKFGDISATAMFARNTASDDRRFLVSSVTQDKASPPNASMSSQDESQLASRAIDALVESRLDEEALEDHLWSRVALSGVRPRTSSELLLAVDGLLTSPTPGAAYQYAGVTSPLNPGSAGQPNPDSEPNSDEFVLVEAPLPANRKTKRIQVRKALAALSSGVFKLPNLKRKREPDTPGTETATTADVTPLAEPLAKRLRFEDYYAQETGKTPPLPQVTRGLIFGHRSTHSAPDVFGPDKSPRKLPPKSRLKFSHRGPASGLGIFSPQRDSSASPLANTLMQLALGSPRPIPNESPKRMAVHGDSGWHTQQQSHFGPAETLKLPEDEYEIDASMDTPLRPSATNFLSSLESPDSALHHMSFSPFGFGAGEFQLEPDSPPPLRPSGGDVWRAHEPGTVSSVPFPSMSKFNFTCPPSPQQWGPEPSSSPRAYGRPGNPTPSAAHRSDSFNGQKHAWPTRAPKPSRGEDSGYGSIDGHERFRMNSGVSTAFDEDMEMEMYDERNRTYSATESEGPYSYEAHEGYMPRARVESDAEVEIMVGRCEMDVDVFSPKKHLNPRERRYRA